MTITKYLKDILTADTVISNLASVHVSTVSNALTNYIVIHLLSETPNHRDLKDFNGRIQIDVYTPDSADGLKNAETLKLSVYKLLHNTSSGKGDLIVFSLFCTLITPLPSENGILRKALDFKVHYQLT